MDKQMSMSFLHDELKEVSTHKKEFLEQIERIMPWVELERLVRPYYYEGKYGNKPYDLDLCFASTCCRICMIYPIWEHGMKSLTAVPFRISVA